MNHVSVQLEDFDPAAMQRRLSATGPGAISTFTGLVRDDGGLLFLTLEQYAGMTEHVLKQLADQAAARWDLSGVVLIHRYGPLRPGDQIVHVACASSHRAEAMEACAFLIDQLKTTAPFWKKETRRDGESQWVDAKASDDAATERWAKR